VKDLTSSRLSPKLVALALATCFACGIAQANPTLPQVVAGSAAFSQQGNTLAITNADKAIIQWQSFSIGANETTRFIQPSSASSVLNRVTGNNPSELLGRLQSNGQVFLINPAGILVGPGASIDTAAFVASTLNLSNADFLANKLNFSASGAPGSVRNRGEIRTPEGGFVYLVGDAVENQGLIHAPGGEILLAAGKSVQLLDTATPGVRIEITAGDQAALNIGQLIAESGRIGIAGAMVRQSGKISASSAISEGGRIFLKATGDDYVEGSASMEAQGTRGGQIEVLGQRVALTDQARLDVSGHQAGGSILIGGDYQGSNTSVPNATISYVGPDVTLRADALTAGKGGKVVVWADDSTRASGTISARGGPSGGDGGLVETSGKSKLSTTGLTVDTSAPRGVAGLWLLDPGNVTISTVASGTTYSTPFTPLVDSSILASDIETSLGNTAVSITTGGATPPSGTITVDAPISWTSTNAFSLQADNKIQLNQSISGTNATLSLSAGPGGITDAANASITANNLAIRSQGDVNLGTASHSVAHIAATLGSAGNLNKNLTLNNSSSLVVDQITDAGGTLNGISSTLDASGFAAATPNGVITLISAGGISQAAGALLSGKAVVAKSTGASVTLTNNNPTGVIAGSAYMDFSYTSSNGIFLTKINADQGVRSTMAGNVTLNAGGNIGQDTNFSGAIIDVPAGQTSLTAANGISLTNNNTIKTLSSATTSNGSITIVDANAGGLSIAGSVTAPAGNKVALGNTAGGISFANGGVITGPAGILISAPSVLATGLDASATIMSSSGMVRVVTDSFDLGSFGNITGAGFKISPRSSATSIEINDPSCAAGPLCLISSQFTSSRITAGEMQIGIGADEVNPALGTFPKSTTISVASNIVRGASDSLYLVSDGNISQSGGAITAQTLGLTSNADVTLGTTASTVSKLVGKANTTFNFKNSGALSLASGVTPFGGTAQSGITASSISLTTGGALTGPGSISGSSLSAQTSAGSIGASGSPLTTSLGTFSGTSADSIFLSNTGNLQLSSVNATGNTVNISTSGTLTVPYMGGSIHTGSGGAISLQSSGNMDIGVGGNATYHALLEALTGSVTLYSTGGIVTVDASASITPSPSVTSGGAGGGGGGGGGTVTPTTPTTPTTPPVTPPPSEPTTPTEPTTPPPSEPPVVVAPSTPVEPPPTQPLPNPLPETGTLPTGIVAPVTSTQTQLTTSVVSLSQNSPVVLVPVSVVLTSPLPSPTTSGGSTPTFAGGTVGGDSANSFAGGELFTAPLLQPTLIPTTPSLFSGSMLMVSPPASGGSGTVEFDNSGGTQNPNANTTQEGGTNNGSPPRQYPRCSA